MKFAFSTNAFTNYPLIQSIEEISKIGYEGVEIMCDVPHAYPPNLNEDKIKEINKTLKNNKMQISNLNAFTLFGLGDTYHPSWIENTKEARDLRINHTIDCINLAEKLGAKNISIEPGGPVEIPSNRDKYLELYANGIREVLPQAEKKQIKILIEPEPELLLESSVEFLHFMKNFDSEFLKLNFDIGHFYCVNEDPSMLVLKLEEYIEHFHMADIKNRKHYHLIPGHGSIDFKKVLATMDKIGYDGYVTVELYPYKTNPVEAASISMKYLNSI
ncbi:sugar phosphate isomerase/epimerase family protein [Candidatus Nitrosocosmicus arcticus]|uniref:Sugar phosphate isomerase/epimerase n=1 Tax=Candidatus Nitrosocosmicus arcticus TaxID=2035267 RepID=A0A557SYJ6_9ARCH|nr:sugar phosphate isomerase/epimerase family protein [Candidatus Nitrosocosmicus arcticus]TVP41679.1 Sugar phosphate isomerase/epimerase [Candidatus Nitrosocosmicus arcticus]